MILSKRMTKLTPDRNSRPSKIDTKLRYIPDHVPGYKRVKWGRGFYYINAQGNKVTDTKKLTRFRELTIPPAWIEVWISPSKKGHLQATGTDDQGRKQYLYHPAWTEKRQLEKVQRMLDFGKALPHIRQQVEKDMRRKKLVKEKSTAIALTVMEKTLIRVGNKQYLQKYRSYGLTTLKKKHIDISENTVTFRFRGKKKVHQEISLQHAHLVGKLQEMQKLPGSFFFQYVDKTGNQCRLQAHDINEYLQKHSNKNFSSKDYRTWYAALWTFRLLAECPDYTDEKACEAHVNSVLDAVSERLGNTRAVCKQYYVPDNLLRAYQDGSLLPYLKGAFKQGSAILKEAERQLLAFFGASVLKPEHLTFS